MKTLMILAVSTFQMLIIVMFFIRIFWVPYVMIGYALSLGCLIYLLVKDRRKMEKEERNDDDRNY
ncbi:hypothetical protein [Pseudalkalibacillus hwajinpoensis]|uniref:hypothetical protein n=1 Tax=Guptibacillus hwajinpoensis TaxID=208199 RepID=UPI001CFCBAC6|nr:hypothetical protein [Pseudalkalibacillus hwajinpoensis]